MNIEGMTKEEIDALAVAEPGAALEYAAQHLSAERLDALAVAEPWAALRYAAQHLSAERLDACAVAEPWAALEYAAQHLSAERLDALAVAFGLDIPAVPGLYAKILENVKDGKKLKMSGWHCGTSHCIAGWTTVVAGGRGFDLEKKTSTQLAARLIHVKSCPGVPIPNYFCDDQAGMAQIKNLAAKEGA